jgi:glycosyltransferase involved in cell wall biosynthesis
MSVMLIDALSARRGGGQTYLVNLLTRLPAGEPSKIYLLAQPELDAVVSSDRVRVVQPRWPMHNGLLLTIWKKLFLRRYAERLGASLLFFPGGIIGAALPAGARSATMFRNVIPFDMAQRRRYGLSYQRLRNWLLERVMLKGMLDADLVIFLSEHGRSLIEKWAGRALSGAVTIPHGVSPSFRNPPAGSRPDWLPDSPYLLYVSTFEPYKAQLEVVQAFARAIQEWKAPLSLVLLGYQHSPYGRRVQREISMLKLEDRIVIPGNRPYAELPAANHHSLITIFASEAENCPNVLLEAMAAGKPILCSVRPPMPEFGGDAVWYFEPSNVEELSAQLLRLLREPDTRAELGKRAAERSRRYDWEKTARATWAALSQLAARHR